MNVARIHPALPDNAEQILACVRVALDNAEDVRKGGPAISAGVRESVAKYLDFEESYLPASVLAEIPELDVPAMVDRVVTDCAEIEIPDDKIDRVEVVWRTKAGTSKGAVTLATCGPVGKRERETYQGPGRAPWWRLTVALDTWILLTPAERWRLIAHELMHATVKENAEGMVVGPAGRTHDVEEFAATIARYGLATWGGNQPAVFAQAMARPEIAAELRVFDVDPRSGQGLLFRPSLMTPVGW